ncbi:quinone-dependent dihydroorotate dehydrogenase [Ketobacter sp. MCCC 1A13808]|mgnify:CR=1 FL=1|nr:quinone-dependent dihydroorotate dehydrogenase [Ketobacter sp. MCCC 1A13808]MVF14425.1 quinone-dependent dihydroorotate dehydrogenase [Ketobacter sp. MCCC 1A13808]RLP52783.1 MAG: quinone-dependent dihydroorotate dehydrogenase [Ketobacter sp.]
MLYALAKRALFALSEETSHHLALQGIATAHKLGVLPCFVTKPDLETELFGLSFKNPVGLAAGLDKNGDYIDALGALGFGFIEIGTVTPRPQPGNPTPRLFRLPQKQAIINRMGFNNKGVDHLVSQVEKSKFQGVLGINIGKNFDTPVERALDDYLICLRKVYRVADYVVINISSPNTQGLRSLQYGDSLDELLSGMKNAQQELKQAHRKSVPILVKIAPDLEPEEIDTIAAQFNKHKVEGVIATNTTLSRQGVAGLRYANEQGGLSGGPVFDRSTETLQALCNTLSPSIPVIGVGGILNGDDAVQKIKAGAGLVQVYSGFIYNGPKLIADCVDAIEQFFDSL